MQPLAPVSLSELCVNLRPLTIGSRNMHTRFIKCLIVLLSLSDLLAQKHDVGCWYIYFGNQKWNARWNWFNEIQFRNYDFGADLEQLLLRTSIGYTFPGTQGNLSAGYAYVLSENYISPNEKRRLHEHRPFQQFLLRQQWTRLYIQHRYRLEERFLAGDFRLRFRYFLAGQLPFNRPTLDRSAIYLSLYNELFVHTDKPVFDRNRLFAAVGYTFNKNLRFEMGWMAQLLENRWRSQLQLVFYNNLPLKN